MAMTQGCGNTNGAALPLAPTPPPLIRGRAKHGTCISTFEKSCYTSYTTEEEYIDFLHATVDLFKTRDTYSILAAAGITPKSSGTYSATAIRAALEAAHGAGVTIRCSSGAIDEVWYSYYVRGSIQTGEFVAAEPVGQSDSCSGNVSYLPKSDTATTATTKTTTTAATATATGTFSGTGYLSVTTSGAATGCLISAGTWYVGGTCATYTATTSGTGFTLKSSKGYCAVGTDGAFGCSSSTTAQVFTAVDGALAPGVWYAASVPSGTTQVKVYDSSTGGTTELVVGWTVV
jgi:ribonuclease T2